MEEWKVSLTSSVYKQVLVCSFSVRRTVVESKAVIFGDHVPCEHAENDILSIHVALCFPHLACFISACPGWQALAVYHPRQVP